MPLNGVSASTTPLLKAVQFEKTNIVRRLIELEVNLDEKSQNDTPLTLACKKRHTEIASLLLEAGADPLVKNNRSDTPLKLAARAGNVDLLSLMTKKGVRLKNEKSEAYFALSEGILGRRLDALAQFRKGLAQTEAADALAGSM